jgi:PAS domain S-box-containing protein
MQQASLRGNAPSHGRGGGPVSKWARSRPVPEAGGLRKQARFREQPECLQLYIVAHCLLLAPLLWIVLQQQAPENRALLGALLFVTTLAGACKLELAVLQGRMSLVFAIGCLALLLQGMQAAVLCAAAGAMVTTYVRSPRPGSRVTFQRQPLHRLVFNVAHCTLACGIAALVFQTVLPLAPGGALGRICALIPFTATYFLVNGFGTALAIAFQQGLNPVTVWKENMLWAAPGFFASAFVSAAVWIAYGALGPWSLLFLPPLYLVYYGYGSYLDHLRQANTLLKEQVAERERAEAALQKEREFLQAVLENVADGIVACDAAGTLSHVNRAARALDGLPEALAPLGGRVRQPGLCYPDGGAPLQPGEMPLSRAFRGQTVRDQELVLLTDTGGERALLASGQPVCDPQGGQLGAVAVFHDITARREAEEERTRCIREQAAHAEAEAARQRFAFLAEASDMLAGSLDYETALAGVARLSVPYLADLCVVDLGESDGRLRRVAADAEGTGSGLPAQGGGFSPGGPEPHPLILEAFRTGEPRVAASPQAGTFTCVPLLARGRTLGVISFFTGDAACGERVLDLSLATDLARRAAFAVDNARLYREVQEGDRRKNLFLAMLGHELRNPLAAMSNALESIRLRGSDHPSLHARLDVLSRQVRHQTRLIDDLLDVSRITQGKIQLRKDAVDLGEVLAQAVQGVHPLIESRGHALTMELPAEAVRLEADPTRLEQVIGNLLTNAAKYSEPGGKIHLSVEVEEDLETQGREEGERSGQGATHGSGLASVSPPREVVIRVRDTGEGIPPEMLPRIFDLFTQVESSPDRAQGGLGLGLSLVQQLVTMHEGRVEARSDGPGRGSEFAVYLPALPDGPPEAPPVAPHDAEAKERSEPLRILLVDDNEDAAASLGEVLEFWGHEVRAAYDGPGAIDSALSFRPEVVLLDIGLPGINGYGVARRLRQREDFKQTRLIALTGYGQEEDRRQSREAGFDHHLVKPVDPETLRALIGHVPAA